MEKVVVTGGNGRIGRAMIKNLNKHGYTSINLDRLDKFATESSRETAEQIADEYLTVDLLNAGEVYGALASSDADAVVHLGTIRGATHNPGHVTYESNVNSTYNILEASHELNLESVCLASSLNILGSVYQTSQGIFATGDPVEVDYIPVDEEHPNTPRDPYAIAKNAVETTADGFGRLDTGPETIGSVRFPWVLFSDEIREWIAEADRTIESINDPSEEYREINTALSRDVLFSYLHVDDAAEICRAVVEAEFTGHEPFWAVATDTTASVESEVLAREYFADAEVRGELRGFQSLISIKKAQEYLDWTPSHSWREF